MGTNYYYFKKPDCKCCGRNDAPLHIGKSSCGWCFALHVDHCVGINSLDDWKKMFAKKGALIKDEYGDKIGSVEMLQIICNRSGQADKYPNHFYKSEEDFLRENHAVAGPRNLVRHRVDGTHCIAHGEGSWDLITGDFS